MNYLDLLKTIYVKEKVATELDKIDVGFCISLTKTLSKDKDNLPVLKQLVDYLFYISPEDYFYLLYFSIPKKSFIPRTMKFEKEKESEDKFLDFLRDIFQYGEREMKIFKEEIQQIMDNKKEWKKELGI